MIGAVVFLAAYGIPIIWPDISPQVICSEFLGQ